MASFFTLYSLDCGDGCAIFSIFIVDPSGDVSATQSVAQLSTIVTPTTTTILTTKSADNECLLSTGYAKRIKNESTTMGMTVKQREKNRMPLVITPNSCKHNIRAPAEFLILYILWYFITSN